MRKLKAILILLLLVILAAFGNFVFTSESASEKGRRNFNVWKKEFDRKNKIKDEELDAMERKFQKTMDKNYKLVKIWQLQFKVKSNGFQCDSVTAFSEFSSEEVNIYPTYLIECDSRNKYIIEFDQVREIAKL